MKSITGNIMCCLLLGAVSLHTNAATPPVYDVEVIFFINNSANDTGELWTNPHQNRSNRAGIRSGNQFTELAQSQYTLSGVRNRLEASGKYTVLLHRAWRQIAHNKSRAIPYPLHSISTNGRDSIEGSITLVRERYLHLDVDALLMSGQDAGSMAYSDAASGYPGYELREKRRIKSGELNYFDHPRFGLIARVTPYSSAQTITEPEAKTASTAEQIQREIDKQVSESSPAANQLTR
ncbi:MAG: CsiV family protein [Gammaproteobacteria bacterium]